MLQIFHTLISPVLDRSSDSKICTEILFQRNARTGIFEIQNCIISIANIYIILKCLWVIFGQLQSSNYK